MRRPAWVGAAGPRRAAVEAGLLAFALTLPTAVLFAGLPETSKHLDAHMWGTIGAMLLVAPFAAFRRRRPAGSGRFPSRREVGESAASLAAIWAGALAALVAGAGFAAWRGWSERETPVLLVTVVAFGAPTVVPAAAIYGFWRGVVLAWPGWDRRRRTRLLWALTHAQLVASLALTMSVAAVLTAAALVSSLFVERPIPGEDAAADGVITTVARLTQQIVPAALVFFVASLVVGVVVVPPVALISARVLRRASRRLEELAAATGALRAGDLATRVPVAGEDEVARLQADFNAMAADLERTLRELAAERDAVARLLGARRELIAAVSHELRTPIATLRGHLESAQAHWDGAPPRTLRDDLAVMTAETERLQRLIEDLFTLSRAEVERLPIALAPTDIGAVLRRTAAAAAPLAWRRGRVDVLADAPPDLPAALVDGARLEQAISNLVANAVRHTPPGGLVLLTAAAEDGVAVVQVKDTGEGIAPDDLARVWERFYRTGSARERDGGGAGLGLALVKELTEAMGGTVAVESAPGQGSTFSLRFPAVATR